MANLLTNTEWLPLSHAGRLSPNESELSTVRRQVGGGNVVPGFDQHQVSDQDLSDSSFLMCNYDDSAGLGGLINGLPGDQFQNQEDIADGISEIQLADQEELGNESHEHHHVDLEIQDDFGMASWDLDENTHFQDQVISQQETQPTSLAGILASTNSSPRSSVIDELLLIKGSYLPMPFAALPGIQSPDPLGGVSLQQGVMMSPYEKRLQRKQRTITLGEEASRSYHRLPENPQSWGSNNRYGEMAFRYNAQGELTPEDTFSADQISEYLCSNPCLNDKNRTLTLWIQTVPSGCESRYAHQGSDKCRFAECPIKTRVISRGSFRVAFDEQVGSGMDINPFHCAGFVHLYCLEKFCDFKAICRYRNVIADERVLEAGRVRMALNRDHNEMLNVFKEFKQSEDVPYEYKRTLCYALTTKHLELQANVRQRTRDRNGGNNISIHKGNLDVFIAGEAERLRERKRKRSVAASEQSMGESLITYDGERESSPPPRPLKRIRGLGRSQIEFMN